MTPQEVVERIYKDVGVRVRKSHILYYDYIGLVRPPRTKDGVREYTEANIIDLTIAVLLSNLGVSVGRIKKLLVEHDFSILKELDERIDVLFEMGKKSI